MLRLDASRGRWTGRCSFHADDLALLSADEESVFRGNHPIEDGRFIQF
jgi:hypothetical protein